MQKRRWVAIAASAGLACALLCAWAALAFLREAPGDADGAAANAVAARALVARDAAAEPDVGTPREETSPREITPTVESFNPRLEWPDVAMLRRIEQRGRLLFGGIVYAPDGSPCPGASVHGGGANAPQIATTDDHGAWRADVARPSEFRIEVDGSDVASTRPILLAARKVGVGFAQVEVAAESGRFDLRLDGGFAFKGTVVDNDDLRRVGGAELEARVDWYVERTRADRDGDFSFPSLPGGSLELSGRAPGYDSNGAFPFDFDRGRDVAITFRLTKAYRLRGRFAPWPSPLVAAANAAVVFRPRSPHGGATAPTPSGAVAADGSYDVLLPVCPVGTIELDTPDGSIWQDDLDVNEEKHDVDLGTIELASPAAMTGRVDVPVAVLNGAIEVVAWVTSERGKFARMRRPIAADGSFRLAPLPAARIRVTVEFDGNLIASLQQASGFTEPERNEFGDAVLLAANEVRDVGVITSAKTIVVGTVRDERGDPVALAQIREVLRRPDGTVRHRMAGFFPTSSDEEGHFHRDLGDVEMPPGRLTLSVDARGFAPRSVEFDLPDHAAWIRRDVVLGEGVALRGTLFDAAGTPLAGWPIRVEACAALDRTRSDGTFLIRGLEAGACTVTARPRDGAPLTWKGIHPETGAVTLRTTDAASAAESK